MAKKKKRRRTSGEGKHRKTPPPNQDAPLVSGESSGGSWKNEAPGGKSAARAGHSAEEAAQQMVYRAFEAPHPRGRVELARKALQLSPDCADAYVLLAEHAPSLPEALDLYTQGVAAGERRLGERGFQEYRGQFWGVLETRPYMRAREGLASCLWAAGQREEAVRHYQELLDLNPRDNQAIRYLLLAALLELEWHKELAELFDRYPDEYTAEWAYARALLAFRLRGDTEQSRALLQEAAHINPHVPAYVTGASTLPREIPDVFTVGGREEAVGYAAQYLPSWKDTPGATLWMRTTLQVALPHPPQPRRPAWSQLKRVLAQLPQEEGDIWEVDLRAIEPAGEERAEGGKIWALVITSDTQRGVLVLELLNERPKDRDVWDELMDAMRYPEDKEPRRPAEIRVTRRTWFNGWKSKLQQVGIHCRLSHSLKHVDHTLDETLPPLEMLGRLARGATSPADWPEPDTLPQQVGEIWQADVRRLPGWIEVEGQLRRPWLYLVVDTESELILATEISELEPPADWLWHGVRQAMCFPAVGEPHRPGVLQVTSDAQRDLLAPHLEPLDVRCVTSDSPEPVCELVNELAEHLVGPRQMGPLIGAPGITLEQVESFFAAAADFYRARPWRDVPADSVIRVACDQFSSGPWYIVVMGQSGLELGLALYEDLHVLRTILTSNLSDEETGRRTTGLSITYGEVFEIAPQDVDAAEEHGWEVAGPEAYPSAMRINPGVSFRAPLKWELRLLEGCLRAVPQFIASGEYERRITVPTESKPLVLEFRWLNELVDD